MAVPALGRAGFAAAIDVSRETLERLTLYLELLGRWQRAINLVGPATLADPWRRHVLDSAQLLAHLPAPAGPLVDLGSGAGFPGMVLALLGVPGVALIEADRRKAEFLRQVARATGAEVAVHAERIERLTALAGGGRHGARAGAFAAPAAARRALPGGRRHRFVSQGPVSRA